MKKILVFSLSMLAGMAALAQSKSGFDAAKFGVGLNGGKPFGDAGEVYGALVGGLASIEYPLKSQLSLTGSIGYSRLSYKKEIKDALKGTGISTSEGVVPLKAGVKMPFNSRVYGQGEMGLAISDGSAFLLSPRVGYEKPLKQGSLAASARYELWTNEGSIHMFALGLEYNFSLKKK